MYIYIYIYVAAAGAGDPGVGLHVLDQKLHRTSGGTARLTRLV